MVASKHLSNPRLALDGNLVRPKNVLEVGFPTAPGAGSCCTYRRHSTTQHEGELGDSKLPGATKSTIEYWYMRFDFYTSITHNVFSLSGPP